MDETIKPDETKAVIARARANRDVEAAVDYYASENAQHAGLAFVDAIEDAYAILRRNPAIGNTRYAVALDLPGLRSWALPRYPYVIFYYERSDYIDVWRVLHGRRDIAAALLEDPDEGPDSPDLRIVDG